MAIVPMQKISLLVHKNDKPKVVGFLQEKGVLQVVDCGEVEGLEKLELDKESHELELHTAELDFAVQFLSRFEEKKKGLQARIDGDAVKLSVDEMEKIVKDYQFEDMVERCKSMEEEMVNLKNEIKSIHAMQAKLMPWKEMNYSLAEPKETESSSALYVSAPLKDFEEFKKEVLKVSDLVAMDMENQIEDKVYVHIACDKSVLNDVMGLITTYKSEIIELPSLKGTVQEELERMDVRLEQIGTRRGQLESVAKDFSKELKELRVAYDYYNWRLQQKLARRNFASTESVILIKGWTPKIAIKPVTEGLKSVTKRFELFEIEPDEDESPPVLLRNKGIMKPFQSVTGIYGLPLPNEMDPTPYLSIFFIVFYGLALTDAAYGFLMFAMMFVVLRYLKIPKESQGLLRLLMYAGIVTFIMGVLFGGWASLTADQAPGWLTYINDEGKKVFIGQKISAIDNPLNVLILSLVLGYIQVLVGVIMNFVWKFKHESKKYALIDHFPWVYLLSMIGFYIMLYAGLLPEVLGGPLKVLLLIGVVGIVLTQGREKKNIVLKFLSGVLGLYGLVGYLSDVLSYSRLLALGLATSIIGLAVNTIAGMVNGVPIIGIVLALIVLIVGHIFNLGINALGAFIHSGRLQFVEFFTKFLEGGGSPFKPLKRDSKFVQLAK
jgi:V/A-type H+-transporting ATPase subunit I